MKVAPGAAADLYADLFDGGEGGGGGEGSVLLKAQMAEVGCWEGREGRRASAADDGALRVVEGG